MTTRFEIDGRKVSLLGYGAMRLPTTADGGFDQELLNRQVKRLLDLGVTYFDTSPVYCRGESERRLGEALAKSGYPRDAYVLATKLSNFAASTQTLEAAKRMFAASLDHLRTDYINCYLLHSVGNGGMAAFRARYLDNGVLDWMLTLRATGKVRNLGFSFHGAEEVWNWCVANHAKYKWDFVQIQMNYVDWRHAHEVNERNLNAERLMADATRMGIPVVVMGPLLGGRLANFNPAIARVLKPLDPEATQASWAFRFCASHPRVLTVLSGMTLTEHIEEDVRTLSPLKLCTEAERAALERAAVAYLGGNQVPCNSCNYCMPCPYGLDIPGILVFRNEYLAKETRLTAAEILRAYARAIPEPLRRAEHCTGCGKCNPHCPQQIKVSEEIAAVDAQIEILKTEAAR